MRITSHRNVTAVTAVSDNKPCLKRTYAQASESLDPSALGTNSLVAGYRSSDKSRSLPPRFRNTFCTRRWSPRTWNAFWSYLLL